MVFFLILDSRAAEESLMCFFGAWFFNGSPETVWFIKREDAGVELDIKLYKGEKII